MTPDEARRRFGDEWPVFRDAATTLQSRLEQLCGDLGISAQVDARAKGVASFVKKIRLRGYPDPWVQVTDKVGARIIVASRVELQRLAQAVQDSPLASDMEPRGMVDKSTEAPEDRLYYPGIHAQVTVPGATTPDGEPIEAELQLRTRAQDLWCLVSHRLDYKGAVRPGKETRRRILRLSVLTEMFDQEVVTAMSELAADPAYTSALYLHVAESEYLRFAAEPGNDELSLEVIELIRSALPDDVTPDGYADDLRAFVASHEAKLQHIYEQFGPGTEWTQQFAYWLFTQPESVIVFHLIQVRTTDLARAVRGSDLESVVNNLYRAWGKSMPDPG